MPETYTHSMNDLKKCNLSQLVLARFIKWDAAIIHACDMQGRRLDQFLDSKFHKKGSVSCKRGEWFQRCKFHTNEIQSCTCYISLFKKKMLIFKGSILEPRFFGRLFFESCSLRKKHAQSPSHLSNMPLFFKYKNDSSQPEIRIHCKVFPLSVLQSFEATKAAKEAP